MSRRGPRSYGEWLTWQTAEVQEQEYDRWRLRGGIWALRRGSLGRQSRDSTPTGVVCGQRRVLPETGQVIRMYCRSWSCPRCRVRMRQQWVKLALRGNPTYFWTLTHPLDADVSEAAIMARLNGLAKYLRRKFGEWEYWGGPERGKRNGMFHLHLLVRSQRVPHEAVQDWWQKHGGGWVWVAQVDPANPKKAANYVTKYQTKQAGISGWEGRMVRYSRRYFPGRTRELRLQMSLEAADRRLAAVLALGVDRQGLAG